MATIEKVQDTLQALQNGDPTASEPEETSPSEVLKKPPPRFLGPPIKIGDNSNNGHSADFLPLGAGGPAPPVHQVEQTENGKEPPTPHVRFLGPPIKIGDTDQPDSLPIEGATISPMIFEMRAVQNENGEMMAVCGAPKLPTSEIESVQQEENGDVMALGEGPMPQSRIPVEFLPLGAGGPPPEKVENIEDLPTPHVRFIEEPITFEIKTEDVKLVGRIPRCPPYENGKAVMEPVGPPGPAPPVLPEEGIDEGDLPNKKTELQDEVTRKFTPRCLGPPLKFEDFERTNKDDESKTPPNTPQGEILQHPIEKSRRDPSRIPLGAGGPAPSTLHPLSKNGIPAQSPPRFPIGPDGWPIGLEQDPSRYHLNTIGPEGLAYPEMMRTDTSECNLATNGTMESPLGAKVPPKDTEPPRVCFPPPDSDAPSKVPAPSNDDHTTPLSGVKTPQEPPPESDAPPKDPADSKIDTPPPTPATPPPALIKSTSKNPPPTLAKPKVVSTLPRKTSVPLRQGAIANLGSSGGSGTVNPLSVAAPRRSHSFIGFSSPSLANSVAGSVHAHRQTFLAKRALFDQPDGAAFVQRKPTAMRRFEIELRALKLGGKSLGDSWVTEEVETREPRETSRDDTARARPVSLQPSHLRRTTDTPVVEKICTKSEAYITGDPATSEDATE